MDAIKVQREKTVHSARCCGHRDRFRCHIVYENDPGSVPEYQYALRDRDDDISGSKPGGSRGRDHGADGAAARDSGKHKKRYIRVGI